MNNAQSATIIKSICKSKGFSMSKLLEECNLRKSLMYDMEKRNYTPSAEILEKIADYLDCSVDYLLGRIKTEQITGTGNVTNNSVIGNVNSHVNAPVNIGNSESQPLTKQEEDLLRIYKNANTRQQIKLMDCALSIEEEMKENKQ